MYNRYTSFLLIEVILMQTLNELFDLEAELLEHYIEGKGAYELIEFYEKLLRVAKAEKSEGDYHYIHQRLLTFYIEHGTYLKTSRQKDENAARKYLLKALTIDKNNAIAHYRLGFIAYKEARYTEALDRFQKAIKGELSPKQMLYAHMYLTNSALYIAEEAKQSLEALHIEAESIPYAVSPYYEVIAANESYLQQHAFCSFSRNRSQLLTKDMCEDILYCPPKNELILYFGDRETICSYNGAETVLEVDSARLLLDMLMQCDADNPGTRQLFTDYFIRLQTDQQVSAATFRKRMSRLRRHLASIGLEEAIHTTRTLNETGYYTNVPFQILCRTDSSEAEGYIKL